MLTYLPRGTRQVRIAPDIQGHNPNDHIMAIQGHLLIVSTISELIPGQSPVTMASIILSRTLTISLKHLDKVPLPAGTMTLLVMMQT
jgi:hypothetical protein